MDSQRGHRSALLAPEESRSSSSLLMRAAQLNWQEYFSQTDAITMLRSDKSIRFTAKEIEANQKIGLDLQGVNSPSDFGHAIIPWIDALGEVRPDLLDRLARELAKAKGTTLPVRPSVVPPPDSPDRP